MRHHDLETLFDSLLIFAKKMLAEYGEFFPFAASVSIEGEMCSLGICLDNECPSVAEIIGSIESAFKERAAKGVIRATGICYNVKVTPPGGDSRVDAIAVNLQHRNGEASNLVVPYYRDSQGELEYGEMFTLETPLTIFEN